MMDNSQVATLETREHIVQCAEELFAAQGYRGISMREIAEATGLAKASIYHHFASKKEIYLQVLERDALVLRDTLEQAATQGKTARERIASVVTAYLELFSSKRNLIQLTLREIAGLETEIRQLVARYRAEVLHPLEAIIQEGVEAKAPNIMAMASVVKVWAGSRRLKGSARSMPRS